MANADEITIETRVTLTPEEVAEVLALKGVCDAAEGLDLKLGFGAADPAEARYPAAWLARADGALVGYLSLDGDETVAEMCGMVHPDWRRRVSACGSSMWRAEPSWRRAAGRSSPSVRMRRPPGVASCACWRASAPSLSIA